MPTLTTSSASFLDEVKLYKLIAEQVEAAWTLVALPGGGAPEFSHFGEDLPADAALMASFAELAIEPIDRVNSAANDDVVNGRFAIEIVADPLMGISHAKVLELGAVMASKFDQATLSDLSAGVGYLIHCKRAARRYAGAPPEVARTLRTCRIEVPFQAKRLGNGTAQRSIVGVA